MRLDGRFHIACEVLVDGSGGVLRKKGYTFDDQSTDRSGGMEHRNRHRSALDDYLCAGADARQKVSQFSDGFIFRDVNHLTCHNPRSYLTRRYETTPSGQYTGQPRS